MPYPSPPSSWPPFVVAPVGRTRRSPHTYQTRPTTPCVATRRHHKFTTPHNHGTTQSRCVACPRLPGMGLARTHSTWHGLTYPWHSDLSRKLALVFANTPGLSFRQQQQEQEQQQRRPTAAWRLDWCGLAGGTSESGPCAAAAACPAPPLHAPHRRCTPRTAAARPAPPPLPS